jgi:hypothetical protein
MPPDLRSGGHNKRNSNKYWCLISCSTSITYKLVIIIIINTPWCRHETILKISLCYVADIFRASPKFIFRASPKFSQQFLHLPNWLDLRGGLRSYCVTYHCKGKKSNNHLICFEHFRHIKYKDTCIINQIQN